MLNKRVIDVEKINKGLLENPAQVIAQTEADFNKRVAEACKQIAQSGVALLAGPSCSGKTTTSLKMKARLEESGHTAYAVALDNFFVHRCELPLLENGEKDLESIATLNIPLLEETMASLAAGKRTGMPVYNFYEGRREDNKYSIQLKRGDVAIIEGLHALNPQITEHVSNSITKIYVDVGGDFYLGKYFGVSWRDARFLRRMVRDSKFRGYPALETIKMWDEVLDAEEKYIIPYAKNADIVIDTSFDYELNYIKKFALPLLCEIESDDEYGIYAKQLEGVLDDLVDAEGELVPKNSLLREFTGGSEYAAENGAI